MNWKDELINFEKDKDWESASLLMQKVIEGDSDNMDAYLSMNYMLMNLLVEENCEKDKQDYYSILLKDYFDLSIKYFSGNSEYLFYTGLTAHISEWYFDIDIEVAKGMMLKATHLSPENILYKWGYYTYFDMSNSEFKKQSKMYAQRILTEEEISQKLKSKGSLGQYVLELLISSSNYTL